MRGLPSGGHPEWLELGYVIAQDCHFFDQLRVDVKQLIPGNGLIVHLEDTACKFCLERPPGLMLVPVSSHVVPGVK